MKASDSLSIMFVMIATCNAANTYGSLSMSLRNQLSHVRRLEREEDKILNDILYLDEMQQSKMPSPRLDKVDRAFLGFEKKDTDTNTILQKPGPTTGTYGCKIVSSSHDARQAWEDVITRSRNDEACQLENIKSAIIAMEDCNRIRISNRIILTATHCLMKTKEGICDNANEGQVIRHAQYYKNANTHQIKHDIAVLYKKKNYASNLYCLQHICEEAASCKIIKRNGDEENVSLAFCTDEDHPDSDIDVNKLNRYRCHTMCVKRTDDEPIPDDLSGSPLICNDGNEDGKWYIRGIMSFKKSIHNDYAMVAMIDKDAISGTTCECPRD